MSEKNAQTSVRHQSSRLKQRSLSKDYQQHANVHGITHVAVQAADHEKFGRRNRRGRAQATDGKLPSASEIDHSAGDDAKDSQPGQSTMTG